MPTIKDWVSAARLRTLPLSLSGLVFSSFQAKSLSVFNTSICVLVFLTTLFLQVLSNFANDYGDTQNGADSENRVGPKRAVQTGRISQKQMLKGIYVLIFLAFFSGIFLLLISFKWEFSSDLYLFLFIGVLCVVAAYFYTAGPYPYGYKGFGDLAVFVFFGLVACLGSLFLFSKNIHLIDLLPAASLGFLATGVLNINNIRDIKSDLEAGKVTVAARLGTKNAKIYHWILLFLAIISMLAYLLIFNNSSYYFLPAILLLVKNGKDVYRSSNPDPYLKTLAISTLIFSLLSGISLYIK